MTFSHGASLWKRNERKNVQELISSLASGVQLLMRSHPANPIAGSEGVLPETGTTLIEYASAIKHCCHAIGVNTSAMLDTIINDTPTFSIKHQYDRVHFKNMTPGLGWHANRAKFTEENIFPRGRAGDIAAKAICTTVFACKVAQKRRGK